MYIYDSLPLLALLLLVVIAAVTGNVVVDERADVILQQLYVLGENMRGSSVLLVTLQLVVRLYYVRQLVRQVVL